MQSVGSIVDLMRDGGRPTSIGSTMRVGTIESALPSGADGFVELIEYDDDEPGARHQTICVRKDAIVALSRRKSNRFGNHEFTRVFVGGGHFDVHETRAEIMALL